MAKAGDVIENPVSGERFTFLKTAADTNGELLQAELALRPGGRVPADHVHPRQEERFEVISGTARCKAGDVVRDLSAGESLVVPPGRSHRPWNETDQEVRILVEFRPALRTEEFFETFCGLASDGKAGKSGLPRNPLQLSVMSHEYEMFLARPPLWLQRPLIAAIAALARLMGYRARYEKYSGPE